MTPTNKEQGIEVQLHADTSAAELSFRTVADALEASRSLREHVVDVFPDLFVRGGGDFCIELRPECADLFIAKPVLRSANGAFELTFNPSERYRELVTTIAGDGYACSDFHGWPILSLSCGNATMTDAPVESICRGGGVPQ